MSKEQLHWKGRFILFLIGQCLTLFGSQVVQMAIVWYVTLRTQSGGWIAAFSICAYLPQFFVSFAGGVWADRYERKRLIIMADGLTAAVTLAMIFLMPGLGEDTLLLTALLLMSLIRSAAAGVQVPAVNAVIPHLVPQKQLMRCNGVNAAMQSLVQFAAPAAAAVVLTASTLRAALVIDIATAVMGIGLLMGLPLMDSCKKHEAASTLAEMSVGFRYAASQKIIGRTLWVYGAFLFLSVPAGYLAGLFVSRVYGDSYWYLTATELVGFGGMLTGGLLMSLWSGFKKRQHTLAAGLGVFGAMSIAMGLSRSFGLYLVFMLVYGVALTSVQTTVTTLLQENARKDMQGRVFGLMSSAYAGFYPLGMGIFGPLADLFPQSGMMLLSGAALMAVAASAARMQGESGNQQIQKNAQPHPDQRGQQGG